MTPLGLICALHAAGVSLAPGEGGSLILRGTRPPPDLLDAARAHKPALLRHLEDCRGAWRASLSQALAGLPEAAGRTPSDPGLRDDLADAEDHVGAAALRLLGGDIGEDAREILRRELEGLRAVFSRVGDPLDAVGRWPLERRQAWGRRAADLIAQGLHPDAAEAEAARELGEGVPHG